MAFTENHAAFFDTQTGFADDVTIGATSGVGIFDAEWADAFGVGGSQPSLLIATNAFPAVTRGDAVTVRGASYTVNDIRPDGTGMTRLILEAA